MDWLSNVIDAINAFVNVPIIAGHFASVVPIVGIAIGFNVCLGMVKLIYKIAVG